MTQDRWIELDGVVNMRDCGGLPTRDGGRIRPRRLIRSDNLQDLSERDVERIVGELGVSDILDLRSETEVRVEGPTRLRHVASLTHHNYSFIGGSGSAAAGNDALAASFAALAVGTGQSLGGDVTTSPSMAGGAVRDRCAPSTGTSPAPRDAAFWSEHYLGYLGHRADAVSAALAVVATSHGATIVHCAAGKDRTGTLVALALDVAGVPHEEIIADYVLSAERLQLILGRLRASELYSFALATQTLEDQLTRPETMAAILDALDAGFGGAAGWLRTQGWSTERVAQLAARLTR